MAVVPVREPGEFLSEEDFVATDPAGDTIRPRLSEALIIEFVNGHVSPISISVAADDIVETRSYGRVQKPDMAIEIEPGETPVAAIRPDLLPRYQDDDGLIHVSYLSGNAALLIRAIQGNPNRPVEEEEEPEAGDGPSLDFSAAGNSQYLPLLF